MAHIKFHDRGRQIGALLQRAGLLAAVLHRQRLGSGQLPVAGDDLRAMTGRAVILECRLASLDEGGIGSLGPSGQQQGSRGDHGTGKCRGDGGHRAALR